MAQRPWLGTGPQDRRKHRRRASAKVVESRRRSSSAPEPEVEVQLSNAPIRQLGPTLFTSRTQTARRRRSASMYLMRLLRDRRDPQEQVQANSSLLRSLCAPVFARVAPSASSSNRERQGSDGMSLEADAAKGMLFLTEAGRTRQAIPVAQGFSRSIPKSWQHRKPSF